MNLQSLELLVLDLRFFWRILSPVELRVHGTSRLGCRLQGFRPGFEGFSTSGLSFGLKARAFGPKP